MKNMINFTVGPVQTNEKIRTIGSEQVPYFRTSEFSDLMLENEKFIKKFAGADENSKVVFITGSGTASMEAVVMNVLNQNDKALIINGGSFGQRFVDLCNIYGIANEEILLSKGTQITENILNTYAGKKYTCLLVNLHETSTGVLYDLELLSGFCKRNNLLFIVDAISSFLVEDINMSRDNIDVLITGSQKALSCPPGISIIVLNNNSIQRIQKNKAKGMYLDLKTALKDAERGQTPWTPAVSILRQIHCRLKEIDNNGGLPSEIKKVRNLANDFRNRIKDLPFEFVTESPSYAITSLHPINASAYDIFIELKDHYNIWICPNGGDLKDKVFRVGHIGDLTIKDNDKLIEAFIDMNKRGLL